MLDDALIKKATDKTNCRNRKEALRVLGGIDTQQSKDIITQLAIHDPVFQVREAAVHEAQRLHITKKGEPIFLGKKPSGSLVKDINKKLVKVRDSLEPGFTTVQFKEQFKAMYPVVFDTYDGDMGSKFDKWLANVIPTLPKKK